MENSSCLFFKATNLKLNLSEETVRHHVRRIGAFLRGQKTVAEGCWGILLDLSIFLIQRNVSFRISFSPSLLLSRVCFEIPGFSIKPGFQILFKPFWTTLPELSDPRSYGSSIPSSWFAILGMLMP